MAYATQTDCEMAAGGPEKLVELADQNHDGTLDAPVLAAAQAQADAWIDMYIRRQYSGFPLPLNPAPPMITRLAAQVAVHTLREWAGTVTDAQLVEQKDRVDQMMAIDRGVLMPVAETYPIGKDDSIPGVYDRPNHQADSTATLSRDDLKGFC